MFTHDAIEELLHKALPGMLYEQRKLRENGEHAALLASLESGIRHTKLFTWSMVALVMINPFVQGFNIIRMSTRDGDADGSLYAVLVFIAAAVVLAGGLVAFQMHRLALMERARFALELVVRDGAPGAEPEIGTGLETGPGVGTGVGTGPA